MLKKDSLLRVLTLERTAWTLPVSVKIGLYCLVMTQLWFPTMVFSTPKTAAETDWVPRNQLSPSQQLTLGPVCSGAYITPKLTPLAPDQDENTVLGEADQAEYLSNKQFELQGNVMLRQGDFQIKSQQANLNQSTNKATLSGDIQIRARDLLLKGNNAEYYMNSGQFDLDNASYLIHDRNLRGKASHISRHELTQLDIDKGTYTSCPPGHKDWSFVASHIHLNKKEGVGSARNVRFRIQDVPVFYLPWFSFPIDNRRKSGFLFPTFGTSNVGSGAFLSAPYYFNLAPNYDLTMTPQYISGRGAHTEAEFRYLNRYSTTAVSAGYIAHDSAFSRLYPELNPQRWGFKLENDTRFTERWRQTINFNAVSDKDYLSDLSRTLRINTQTELNRAINWTYSGDWSFTALFHGYQTVDKSIAEVNRPYARLPELTLSRTWDQGPFVFDWYSQYSLFYRNNQSITTSERVNGSRLRLIPDVSWPLRTTWGFLIPSVKLDQTQYLLQDRLSGEPTHISRTVPFFTLDSGLYFDRETHFFGTAYTQSFEPRLFYVYSRRVDQSTIPNFDTTLTTFSFNQLFADDRFVGGDRVGDNDHFTLGITNRFNEESTGIDRAVLSIGQIFYLKNRTVNLTNTAPETRNQSDWAGELNLKPLTHLDVKIAGIWDPRSRTTNQGSTTLSFHSSHYRYLLNMSHRYQKDSVIHMEQTDVSAIAPLSPAVSVFGRWLYDKTLRRTTGSLAGVEYQNCCWRVQLFSRGYFTSSNKLDNAMMLRFELKGLSTFGANATEMDALIPGYKERETYISKRDSR
jgi:LPS-assembly protein